MEIFAVLSALQLWSGESETQLRAEASASQIAPVSVSCPFYHPGQTMSLLGPPPT